MNSEVRAHRVCGAKRAGGTRFQSVDFHLICTRQHARIARQRVDSVAVLTVKVYKPIKNILCFLTTYVIIITDFIVSKRRKQMKTKTKKGWKFAALVLAGIIIVYGILALWPRSDNF